MSKIFQGIFGGSRSNQEAGNRNLTQVNAAATPTINRGNQAGDMMAAMLGFGGDPAAAATATERLANSTGQNFIRDQGSQAITNNAASRGLLGSGGVLRRLTQFGQSNASTFMKDLFGQLNQQQALGLQGLGTMANAGQYSKGSSSTKPGITKFLGSIISGGAGG